MKTLNNIVLIDDNKIDCFINKKIITLINTKTIITIYNNAETALNTLKKAPISTPDLILLDINMPVMNGFEFLNELAKLDVFEKKSIAVFFLSSSNSEQDLKEAFSNKLCSGYINKPLTKQKFLKITKKILELDINQNIKREIR